MNIVSLLGSPQAWSRPAWLLERLQRRLSVEGTHRLSLVTLRNLPPDSLLRDAPALGATAEALAAVAAADALLIGTPVRKGSFSGLLKAFLDLLPDGALRGKQVLVIGTGAQPGALDESLRPVLRALGATAIDSLIAADVQLQPHPTRGYIADEFVLRALERSLRALLPEIANPALQPQQASLAH
jgi:FMN reductase